MRTGKVSMPMTTAFTTMTAKTPSWKARPSVTAQSLGNSKPPVAESPPIEVLCRTKGDHRLHEFDVDGDGDFIADQQPTTVEGLVPGQAEVSAVQPRSNAAPPAWCFRTTGPDARLSCCFAKANLFG
jgi:hypothetical protein